jgi:hypothetical protein
MRVRFCESWWGCCLLATGCRNCWACSVAWGARRSRGFSFPALVGRPPGNRRRVVDRHRPFHASGSILAVRRNGCSLLSSPRSAGSVANSKRRGTGGPVLLHLSVPTLRGSGTHPCGSAGSARERVIPSSDADRSGPESVIELLKRRPYQHPPARSSRGKF